MDKGMKKDKWNDNVIYSDSDLTKFLKSYFDNKSKSILFILGKGFDLRQNNGIKELLKNKLGASIECLVVDYPLEKKPMYHNLIKKNEDELKLLLSYKIKSKYMKLDFTKGYERGLKNINRELYNCDFGKYSDIIVDISALPRSIFFNVIKTLYFKTNKTNINIFSMVSENFEMDRIIQERSLGEVEPIFGFQGRYNMESLINPLKISIPIIGESREEALKRTNNKIDADAYCPILPFPSRNLRRSDNLLKEYYEIFHNNLRMSASDFSYVDERNPFELYITICGLMDNYKKSLAPLGRDFVFVISNFASKLLSLGTLLVALDENRAKEVTIFNVKVNDYTINCDENTFINMNKNSELFMIWIDGEAYK